MKKMCPLCKNNQTYVFACGDQRSYMRCCNCGLIFVPEQHHLSPAEEKKRYDQHQNHPRDQHYRQFLSQLFEPLHKKLSPRSKGLDFGSGPGPTLNLMFEEAGHTMHIYDPFYAANPAIFNRQYDFITATEVTEHLSDPAFEFDRLWRCLKPAGYLGIMTKHVPDDIPFIDWHYIRDETHITFFSKMTFQWLARRWNAKLGVEGSKNIAIFQKKSNDGFCRNA